MDAERIAKTEKEIQAILPPRPQYVVSTSDYDAMRHRLIARLNDEKGDKKGQPRLRVAPGAGRPASPSNDSESRPAIRRQDLTD
jgi:hypothetical protein